MKENQKTAEQMSVAFIAEKIVRLLKGIPNNSKMLDIATGQGYLLEELESAGYTNLHSADINGSNFRLDKEKYHFTKVNANEHLPYPDGCFDVVISSETIEHLENPRFFLREIYRILKKDGILILTTPNVETIFSRLFFLFTSGLAAHTDADYTINGHIAILPDWLIARFIKSIGFERLGITYNCGYFPIFKIKTKNALVNKLFGWIVIYKFKKV